MIEPLLPSEAEKLKGGRPCASDRAALAVIIAVLRTGMELEHLSRSEVGCAAWDGHKRTWGSKLHAAVNTLGQVLAPLVMPTGADDRAAVSTLADAELEATGDSVNLPISIKATPVSVAAVFRPRL